MTARFVRQLKLSAASCGESSILMGNKTSRFRSPTLRQAVGNVLAGGFVLVFALSVMAVCGFAQTPQENDEYQPRAGQIGKDVMWIPTAQALAEKMLNLAQVTPQDYVIDLGSGDGRIVIAAAKRGARGLGIEYNPDLVKLSTRNAAREGVGDKARFIEADIFKSDFSPATVITMFLLPELNLELRPAILDLKPGTRIVSNYFDMGEWQADQSVAVGRAEGCDSVYCQAYLWIVPAKVEGTWKLPQGELELRQSFQLISGVSRSGADQTPIVDGHLSGDQISFRIGNSLYTGRVTDNTMAGTFQSGGSTARWNATRAAR
jgi:SAM-dependent methyltransferase